MNIIEESFIEKEKKEKKIMYMILIKYYLKKMEQYMCLLKEYQNL